MLGNIYTSENCGICGKRLKHREARGVICPNHPQVQAKKMRVHFKGVKRRFRDGRYRAAYKFLSFLRGSVDGNAFDPRDYQRSTPLGFTKLVEEFLQSKRHIKAAQSYRCRLDRATSVWANKNIKEIQNLEIARFRNDLLDRVSSYYAHIILSLLKTFWRWCFDMGYLRYGIDPFPKFEPIRYEMAFRKIVDSETQQKILDQIEKDTKDNPRIFIAINMLRTYLHVRPMELVGCNEEHLSTKTGTLIVPTSKEGRTKLITLHDEDVANLLALPRGFPRMPLFRYDKGVGGQRPGSRFGHHVLLNTWNRACGKLGISGVPLYPGTRHSTAIGLGKKYSPETIKALTGHSTSKAFERYFRMPEERIQELYSEIRGKKGKVIEYKRNL